MNKIKSVLFSAGISLALAFTFGCSSDDGGDNSGGGSSSINVNPQIYIDNLYYDDNDVYHHKIEAYKGSGDIKVMCRYFDQGDKDTLINAGSVTNGIVNLKLPTIPNECLWASSDLFIGKERDSYCTSYPEAVKFWKGEGFELTDNNGKEIGFLGIKNEPEDKMYEEYEGTSYEIMYTYFQENVKITCKENVQLANIDAKKGWNVIYYAVDYTLRSDGSSEIKKIEWSTNSNILKGKEIKWFFSPPFNPYSLPKSRGIGVQLKRPMCQ